MGRLISHLDRSWISKNRLISFILSKTNNKNSFRNVKEGILLGWRRVGFCLGFKVHIKPKYKTAEPAQTKEIPP